MESGSPAKSYTFSVLSYTNITITHRMILRFSSKSYAFRKEEVLQYYRDQEVLLQILPQSPTLSTIIYIRTTQS
jgi:hypothetical protein